MATGATHGFLRVTRMTVDVRALGRREEAGRVAIVHEWIAARAGSEQVFEVLAQMFPQADLYALSADPSVTLDTGRPIRTTHLDRRTLRDRRNLTLPLMPLAWRLLGSNRYDAVLTSHHAFAITNRLARRGAPHLAYVHSPARYLWTPELDRRAASRVLALPRALLRQVDRHSAARVTHLAANSAEVSRRIRRFWGRHARVIHPPVDVEFFGSPDAETLQLPEQYVLGLGRWIPYKHHEMVIEVGERLALPVVIAGSGPLAEQLRARASRAVVPTLVLEAPSRQQVRELYRRAAALVFPTMEDFGMVPVEAMAAGTPVVALAQGGATETVSEGVSGALVREHSIAAYAEGVRRAFTLNSDDCGRQAARFSRSAFEERIHEWVAESLGDASPGLVARA